MMFANPLPHHWQVLAVVLLSGSLTALCYGLSQAGLAEIASAFLSFYLFFVGQRLFAKIATSRASQSFKETSRIIQTFYRELSDWVNNRQLLALCLLGVPVTVVFISVKAFISFALGAFANIWIAIAFGLLVSAFVSSPLLFKGVRDLIFTPLNGEILQNEEKK